MDTQLLQTSAAEAMEALQPFEVRQRVRRRVKRVKNRLRRRNKAYVRGRVSHPDHKTSTPGGWHRALLNTEHAAAEPALERVVFCD